MKAAAVISVISAFCFAGALHAQSAITPAPSVPAPHSASPSQMDPATAHPGAQTSGDPASAGDPGASASARQGAAMRSAAAGKASAVVAGMSVQTRSGEALGTVSGVTRSSSGDPAYVVISSSEGASTAMPYFRATHMVRENRIVVDKARLTKAPKVQESEMQDPTSATWKKVDSYWGRGKHGAHSHEGSDQAQSHDNAG